MRLGVLILLVAGMMLSGCQTGLTSVSGWNALRERALANHCDPYFTRPFRNADQVDVVLIAQADSVRYDLHQQYEQRGEYVAVVETVLFGHFTQPSLAVPFHHHEDGLGHDYGNDVPLGRAMLYFNEERRGTYTLVRSFPC